MSKTFYTFSSKVAQEGQTVEALIVFSNRVKLKYTLHNTYPFQASFLSILSFCCNALILGLVNGDIKKFHCSQCDEKVNFDEARIYFNNEFYLSINKYLEAVGFDTFEVIVIARELELDCRRLYDEMRIS